MSLLLQTSTSFFQATKNTTLLNATIDASCNVPSSTACSSLLASYATTLLSKCSADYALRNPIVTEAYAGFLAYSAVYWATCLVDPSDGQTNCFAEALANTSDRTRSYVYYLPLGVQLPAGSLSQSSCGPCLQATMQGFRGFKGNKTQAFGGTYDAAVGMVKTVCGATWLNQTSVGKSDAVGREGVAGWLSFVVLFVVLLVGL